MDRLADHFKEQFFPAGPENIIALESLKAIDLVTLDTKLMVCSKTCPFIFNLMESIKICPICDNQIANPIKLSNGILRSSSDPSNIYTEAIKESFNTAI